MAAISNERRVREECYATGGCGRRHFDGSFRPVSACQPWNSIPMGSTRRKLWNFPTEENIQSDVVGMLTTLVMVFDVVLISRYGGLIGAKFATTKAKFSDLVATTTS